MALAGYANAGKSSLLNVLSGEHVLVDARMFSTLSTTTRTLLGKPRRILLTDTIGFVDAVPFWMVEALNATMEEIFQADLVLLLIDASDPIDEIRRKIRLAARTLLPKVAPEAILPVLTKVDLVDDAVMEEKSRILNESEFLRAPLALSAETGRGLESLRDAISTTFTYPVEVHLILSLDAAGEAALHWLHEHGDVGSVVHGPAGIGVVVRCRTQDLAAVEALGRVLLTRTT